LSARKLEQIGAVIPVYQPRPLARGRQPDTCEDHRRTVLARFLLHCGAPAAKHRIAHHKL